MIEKEGKRFCPLCEAGKVTPYHRDDRREYLQCERCSLVFVPTCYYLSAEAEQAEYDLHRNDPADSGYRTFLSRLHEPMLQLLQRGEVGLDFGSGPGPTLSLMFAEHGMGMEIYDHFYAAKPEVFFRQYDFITSTEVVEHLHRPGAELNRLWRCLKAAGFMGIMTKLVRNRQAFSTWHYIHDPTHVCFFSKATWQWLAASWGAVIRYQEGDVIILQKT